jgi:transposase
MAARADVNDEAPIHEQMRKQGVPVRDKLRHLRWEPHDGVPPMFEFSQTELEAVNSEQIEGHDGATDDNTDYALSRADTGVDWSAPGTTSNSDDSSDSASGPQSDASRATPGRPYQSEQWLREQYVENGLEMSTIAEKCNVAENTIYRWIDRHNIETRSGGRRIDDDRLNDPEWLRAAYWDRGQTTHEIAETCECSQTTVQERLREYDIKTRKPGEEPDDER